jgi:hypothetical protein
MEAVLDFARPVDVGLIDSVVATMNNPSAPQRALADRLLTAFRDHPEAWTRVGTILEATTSQHTKYFALQVRERGANAVLPVLFCTKRCFRPRRFSSASSSTGGRACLQRSDRR